MKIRAKIRKIIRLSVQSIDMIFYNTISILYKKQDKYKNMWLISERGTEAKDNGYVFFKYLRENHPEINAWYVIDTKYQNDYNKIKDLGNIIEYKTKEHKIAFLLCDKAISTHIGFLECWSYKLYKLLIDRKSKKKYILLQHGIINHDLSDIYNKKQTKIDLFITTTKNEYESIKDKTLYGYEEHEVVKTGLARFDNLYNDSENEKERQILLMPTWRKGIVQPSYSKDVLVDDKVFLNSQYFNLYNSFLNNLKLKKILKDNNIKLIFYPHYEIQPYLKYFSKNSDDIIFASKEEYDVQTLLIKSKLLITDYSSVFFDFAYMKKPIIYYHFDKGHYSHGYFSHKEDGFGNIVESEEKLINEIDRIINNDFNIDDIFLSRIENTFDYVDNQNCKRIYDSIINIK